MSGARDHGGGLDAAVARFGGARGDWIDLSTGINPVAYPVGNLSPGAWTALPDRDAMARLLRAARSFWGIPDRLDILAANGASAIIAALPRVVRCESGVHIPAPTYNEHAAAFSAAGVRQAPPLEADIRVYVHPNNPDGRFRDRSVVEEGRLTIIDESFCDVSPERSLLPECRDGRVVVLKSFGKFWGLAGLRLGFAIGEPSLLEGLRDLLGPWGVSGPALEIGARALEDSGWAGETRARLASDASRLDDLATRAGVSVVGGTSLFRLYEVSNALAAQEHLARHHVWSRVFPYSRTWLRLGLPHPDDWAQLEAGLVGLPT